MRIARAALEPTVSTRPLEAGPFPTGLGVVFGDTASERSQLADLIAETVFGVSTLAAASDTGTTWNQEPGQVEISASEGLFRLRRSAGVNGHPKFTIASLSGASATPSTLLGMQGTLSQDTVARLCCTSQDGRTDLANLLSESVARDFHSLPEALETRSAQAPFGAPSDRSQLFTRRDEIAHEIELRLADRRRASTDLEAKLQQLDAIIAEVTSQRETLQKSLAGVEAELATVESRLRYHAIAEETDRVSQQRESSEWQPKLDDLESQIEHWRVTLADLERREAEVRAELSLIHPDDAEPELPLADQRAGIAVARRLIEDLESEVARLARSAASDLCVCRDAHPRLNPLVDTLGKQLSRLAELADQQEQALHVQTLQNEAAHLARSQDDLRKQLDHLLSRRQTLWRTTRSRTEVETVATEAYEPTSELRAQLDARRHELSGQIAECDRQLNEARAEQDRLSYQRSNLLSDASLDALQSELHDLQARLQGGLDTARVTTSGPDVTKWRASEWFAKLVDGRYHGLRLIEGGRRLVVIGADGQEYSSDGLSDSDRQLAAMSLRLALLGGLSARGLCLPLLLDEPFAGLDSRQAAILANVLDDFSRLGFQVIVFTGCEPALDRFKALGAPLLRMTSAAKTVAPTRVASRQIEVEAVPPAEPIKTTRTVTKVSEYLLTPDDPIERFPVPIADRTGVFARSRIRTISDLMSADPSAVAEELDRDDVSAELVALWQTHLAFVCFVPEMSFEDASLLTAVGVLSAEELSELDADELATRVAELLSSERGSRYRQRGYASSRQQASGWIRGANRGAKRWRSSSAWKSWQRHRGERRQRLDANRSSSRTRRQTLRVRSAEGDRNGKTKRTQKTTKRSTSKNGAARKWRFYLETTSGVVDAPSIGPKTAERVSRAGVRTVAELLAADAEALAVSIDNPRITAETIVAWQHQAGLVCRIPQLRGHDAQVLVACGFTTPEEIAAMKPAELLEFVEPFCASSEGEKVLRGNKKPDLAEVTDWITWAQHCRMLGAA